MLTFHLRFFLLHSIHISSPKLPKLNTSVDFQRKKLSWSQLNNSRSKGSTCKIKLQYKTSDKTPDLLNAIIRCQNLVFKISNQSFWILLNALQPCAKHSTAKTHITAHLVAESHLPVWPFIAQFHYKIHALVQQTLLFEHPVL